jgi:hypothetical protein
MGSESLAPAAPKVILRAYDVPHRAFGGVTTIPLTDEQLDRSMLSAFDYMAKGAALASTYPRAFLRRHILQRDLEAYTGLFSLRTFPTEVVEPTWWSYLDAYDQLPGTVDCSMLTGEQACTAARGCAWDGMDCQNQPVILGSRWGGAAEPRALIDIFSDGQRFETNVAGPGPFDDWEIDEAHWLSVGRCDPPIGEPMQCESEDARSYIGSGHATSALRLRSDGQANRYARWDLDDHPTLPLGPLDASEYTHVRLRAGIRSSLLGPPGPPIDVPANCEVEDTSAWALGLELVGGQARSVPLGPLVQQDVIWARLTPVSGSTVDVCARDFFMATFDIPMADVCDAAGAGGFSVDQLTELALLLPTTNGPGEVIVDTIELVTEEGSEDALCGRPSGLWGCEVDELDLVRASCDREPIAGVCPTAGVVQTPVDAPTVPAEWGGPLTGFVVHAPAGWVVDNGNPSSNGVPVPYTLDAIEIDLMQPAMGIDFDSNNWKGFPEGSLLLRSHLESGPVSFETLDVNHEPVFLEAVEGWLKLQGTGGFVVLANLPCPSGEVKPLKAWVELQSVSAPHGPPTVSINMPSTVTCSTVVNLVASAGDPEGDHGPVTWFVDGVLMDSSVMSIDITEPHTIQAIVRDARGATTTATHEIDCT